MPSFQTILFGNLEVVVELDSEGLVETVVDKVGNELEFHDTLFKDEKGMFVPLESLLYDKISEAVLTAKIERYNYDYGRAVRDRRE